MIDLLLISGIVSTARNKKNYLYPVTQSIPIASIYEKLKEKYLIKIFIPSLIENYLHLIPEAKIYGFSICYHEMIEFKKILNFIKNKYPNSIIVVGGQYPSLFEKQVFDYVDSIDYIVKGNSVDAMTAILEKKLVENISTKHYSGKIIFNREDVFASFIEDKNAYWGLNWNDYNNNPYCHNSERWIVTHSGCLYNCSFCTNDHYTNKKILYRDLNRIIKEINEALTIDNNMMIMLTEPTFNSKNNLYRKKTNELLNRIYHETSFTSKNNLGIFCKVSDIDENFIENLSLYKDKINYTLVLGIENFDNDILKDMNKFDTKENIISVLENLKKYPFIRNISSNIILGTPKDTIEKFYMNYETTHNLYKSFDDSHINLDINSGILWLLPGSKYYQDRHLYREIFVFDENYEKQIQYIDEYNIGLTQEWFEKWRLLRSEWDNLRI